MQRTLLLLLFSLLMSLASYNAWGQSGKLMTDKANITKFKCNSFVITHETAIELDTLAKTIQTDEFKDWHIILSNHSYGDELKKNKYIGANRALEIINYLEDKYKIGRHRFYYKDYIIKELDQCKDDKTGITISLQYK